MVIRSPNSTARSTGSQTAAPSRRFSISASRSSSEISDLLLLHPDVQVAAQVYGGREGNGGLQGYGREGDKLHSGRARDVQLLLGDRLVRDRGEYVVEGLGHEGLPAEDSFDYRAGSLTLAESGNVRPLDDPAISPFKVGGHVLVLQLYLEDGLAVHHLFLGYLHAALHSGTG